MPSEGSIFLDRLADLWARERRASRARFVAERRGTTLAERVARGIALRDLTIDETDAAPGGRTLLWLATHAPGGLERLRIGPGDPVRLWFDDPDGPEALLGVCARRRSDRLGVVVDGDVPERFEDGEFKLDRDDPDATFERGRRAIAAFRAAPERSDAGRLREVLFGRDAPAFDREPETTSFDSGLNGPQRAAVRRALAARDVALVHGPPGTGKTTTLVEIIRQAVARGERVLATAASNTAVDNLAERLDAAGVELVRLGHPARVSPAMEARTLDVLLRETEASGLARRWLAEANAIRRKVAARSARGGMDRRERREALTEARQLQRDARRHLASAQEALLHRVKVVCATAAGADAAVLGDLTFDRVVVDEATQAPDPILLVPLLRAPRAVLAGDPHQLPPTVVDPEAARAGLAETVFERLAREGRGDPLRMLTVQHRMHADLMAFPSASKYGGELVAAETVAEHTLAGLPGVSDDPLRPVPLVFIDTAGKGWDERRADDDPSTSNPGQAERTAAEVRRLLGRGLAHEAVAVITPYDAQVCLLRELLAPEVARGLEIGSVDGFQGREKEAIVLDLVRSNPEGALGFLADTRRMNVALTRARRQLVVIGDSATLGGDPYYAAFLEAVEARGAWISAWTDEAPPFGDG